MLLQRSMIAISNVEFQVSTYLYTSNLNPEYFVTKLSNFSFLRSA